MTSVAASAVIPTCQRSKVLARTLESLLQQHVLPAELVVVDASSGEETRQVVEAFGQKTSDLSQVRWLKAETAGAAAQRNQGVKAATQPVIWFFDDDILFEDECVPRLWAALQSSPEIGGVNAMITNQRYQNPGRVSRLMFRLMAGENCASYAGRILGPAVNLLPQDREDLPEVVPVEWLNTTCTMYRREALPEPPFPTHFTGYSLMEDVTLSLLVARSWKLANVRTARIFHDSQQGSHKRSVFVLSRMQLVNRYYVMTQVLRRKSVGDHLKLLLWEIFGLVSSAFSSEGLRSLLPSFLGRLAAVPEMCKMGHLTV